MRSTDQPTRVRTAKGADRPPAHHVLLLRFRRAHLPYAGARLREARLPVLQLRQHVRPRPEVPPMVHSLLDRESPPRCYSPFLSPPFGCRVWGRSLSHRSLPPSAEANGIPAQPIIPLSIKGYQDVACHICNFRQPLENRPDVTAMHGGQGQMAPATHNGPAQHGWQQGPPPNGPPPHQAARYG